MDNEKNLNKNEKRLNEELKKFDENEKNKTVCPYCNREVIFVWVHGHYQCPFCKNVVIGCCGDE